MARAYLDINIFRQVEDPAIWHAIRRNLRAGGHRVVVGDAIIGEAIRLDDPAVRARQLRCMQLLEDPAA